MADYEVHIDLDGRSQQVGVARSSMRMQQIPELLMAKVAKVAKVAD
jgi:hypothetical protein